MQDAWKRQTEREREYRETGNAQGGMEMDGQRKRGMEGKARRKERGRERGESQRETGRKRNGGRERKNERGETDSER
jgi:hypothetical protein